MSLRIALPVLVCSAVFAQQQVTEGTPQFRAGTSTVVVEAVVTGKKGDYPRDLTAKDFRLWQDGKEQAIASLSFEPGSSSPHFLVLFFDDTRVAAGDKARALQDVSRFIDATSAPHRQMGVVGFDGTLRVAQGFTDDAGTLKDALRRTGVAGAAPDAPQGAGAQGVDSSASDAFSSRNMLQALGNLARSLGVLPGRKTIVLFTGGFPFTGDLKSRVDAAVEESAKSGVAIYPVDLQSPGADIKTTQTARAWGRRLQGPDEPPPASQGSVESGQSLLLSLANRTGGFVISTSDRLLPELQRIGQEQSEYYLLSYTPPESKAGTGPRQASSSKERACHALRVKTDRPGTMVRARSSYCAVNPTDLIAKAPEAEDLEKRAAGSDSGNLQAAIALPYFYGSGGLARLHLAVELPTAGLKFENFKGKLHAEINLLGIASAPDSSVAARFTDALKFDFDTPVEVENFQRSSVHYEKELKIAPGAYSFVLTFSSGPENFGRLETPLAIGPWNPGQFALSSIVLSRQAHPATDPGPLSTLIQDRTPLVAQGTQFVPAGSREFPHSGEGFFYLELYSSDPDSLTVRVRVLDQATGHSQWDSGVTKLPIPKGSRKFSVSAGAGLPLSSLQVGSYRLEITASDSSGKQAQRTSDFEVN